MIGTTDQLFLSELATSGGPSISSCFMCQKCSAGCLLTGAMDHLPHQIVEMVQLGFAQEVLASSAIWVCTSCEACAARCPNGIDVGAMMGALRKMAVRRRTQPGDGNIVAFHTSFLAALKSRGRIGELDLVLRYKLRTHLFRQDLPVGLAMLRRGRLPLFPSRVRRLRDIRRLFRS